MPKKEYSWEDGSTIEDHSISKHKALYEYLIRFVQALSPSPLQEKIYLDIVDGFAGGGTYKTIDGKDHPGSPIQILRALEYAEIICNEKRKDIKKVKNFKVLGDKYFIDNSPAAINGLKNELAFQGYGNRINKDISIIHSKFEDTLPKLLETFARRRRKVIFLLDQYGYQDATTTQVQKIFNTLGDRAEVILTLATDSIISYISKDSRFKTAIKRAKLEHIITDEIIERFKDAPEGTKKQERIAIQYIIANQFHRQSGARWGNSLFIKSQKSNRAYLYLHLSNNFKAREEMNQVFWNTSNEFVQDAGKGINMFEYDPARDIQTGFDFLFDDASGSLTIAQLEEDLEKRLASIGHEMTFRHLLESAIETQTPAGTKHFREAIFNLKNHGVIDIETPKKGDRHKASSISKDDLIKPSKQASFIF